MADVGVYAIVNVRTDYSYVGQSTNIWRRFRQHRNSLRLGKHHCAALQRAWNETGPAAFRFCVAAFCSPENLDALEQSQLDWVATAGCLYNSSQRAGGGSPVGWRQSDTARQHMSAVHRGRLKSAEHRARISAALKGRKKSPEHVAKLPQNRPGKTLSAAHRAKLAAARIGWKHSDGTRAKIAESNRRRKSVGR